MLMTIIRKTVTPPRVKAWVRQSVGIGAAMGVWGAWSAASGQSVPQPDLQPALERGRADDDALGGSRGSEALQVLAALQGANQLRVEAGRRRADAERIRMELAAEAARLKLETARLKTETESFRTEARKIRETLGPVQQRAEAVEALEFRVVDRIHQALDRLAGTVPPGVVPARPEKPATTASGRVDAALDRLEATERQLAAVTVEVVEGRLRGTPLGVELLRFGGAAAWWISLDGTSAGWALPTAEGLELRPGPDLLIGRVERAVQMAKGRATALPITLPLPPDAAEGGRGR